jgi:hypothetical protein
MSIFSLTSACAPEKLRKKCRKNQICKIYAKVRSAWKVCRNRQGLVLVSPPYPPSPPHI